eukprot:6319776-Lingulodinium_polyedra.AAC.1
MPLYQQPVICEEDADSQVHQATPKIQALVAPRAGALQLAHWPAPPVDNEEEPAAFARLPP